MANEALDQAPGVFLSTLKEGLTTCRAMVWSLILTKRFDGFEDAEGLIKAYDHLDKTLSIFSKFQLPLPGMGREKTNEEKAQSPLLPSL